MLTIRCACGKTFSVKEKFRDRDVRCQACDEMIKVCEAIIAESEDAPEQVEPVTQRQDQYVPEPIPAESSDDAAALQTIECPACAEIIPADAQECPTCGESLVQYLDPGQQEIVLQKVMHELRQTTGDAAFPDKVRKAKGGFLSAKSIILAVVTLAFVALIIVGLFVGQRDRGAFFGFGFIFGIPFMIALIVSLINDYVCHHVQDAKNPQQAFKRYFKAVKTGRCKKAFACLAPSAQKRAQVALPQLDVLPADTHTMPVNDLKTFIAYWRQVFRGPKGYSRRLSLQDVYTAGCIDDVFFLVNARFLFMSSDGFVYRREKKTVKRLLVKHNGLWYIPEPGFLGRLDRVSL